MMTGSDTQSYETRLIANRYQLKKLIGKGGMGRVYQAADTLLGGVSIAVKFLSQSALDEKMQQSFAREARICALLGNNSIHIVRVMDYGIHASEEPYYVMEYLQGQSLKQLLDVRPLLLSEFILLTRQICIGLQCAHNGIELDGKTYPVIHRDIKPANIFVFPDPSLGQFAKILDFGIAKFFSEHTCMTQTNSYIGTLAYSSPEQIEGGDLDVRSDIYSLGVMMFEMLTGKLPWQLTTASFGGWYKAHHYQAPRTFAAVNANLKLPKAVEDLVMSCLAKSANDRPATMSEILKILDSLQQSADVTTWSQQSLSAFPTNGSKEKTRETKDQPRETVQQNTNSTTSDTLRNYQLTGSSSNLSTVVEEACWKRVWPQDKPISPIVFPNYIYSKQETVPSLWVMLPKSEVKKHLNSFCYNQFLFSISPHPMLLWVTAIYNTQHGFKWLPCYLDLKSSKGQDVTGLLEKAGYYPLLFFSLEKPNSCVLVRSVRIPSSQRTLLKDWADASQSATPTAPATMSKSLLKVEYEKIKPAISLKLESAVKTPLDATSTGSLNLDLETEITSWETQSTMKTLEWLE